jgi:hypothetical protein
MGRYPRRFTTIEMMEETAKLEEDATTSRRIGEHWLEVKFELDDKYLPSFRYFWKAVAITRTVAVEIMERAIKQEAKVRV